MCAKIKNCIAFWIHFTDILSPVDTIKVFFPWQIVVTVFYKSVLMTYQTFRREYLIYTSDLEFFTNIHDNLFSSFFVMVVFRFYIPYIFLASTSLINSSVNSLVQMILVSFISTDRSIFFAFPPFLIMFFCFGKTTRCQP